MSPAVSSSNLAIGTRPVDGTATLSELSKQVQTLRQKLAKASKADTRPPASDQTVNLSSAIVSVQAQIERVMLDAQLSKLAVGTPAPGAVASTPASTDTRSSVSNGDGNGNGNEKDSASAAAVPGHKPAAAKTPSKLAAVNARYQAGDPQPTHLDEKA